MGFRKNPTGLLETRHEGLAPEIDGVYIATRARPSRGVRIGNGVRCDGV